MKKMLILLLVMLCLIPVMLAEGKPEAITPVLMLESNRTTGYDWSWEVDQEDIVGVAGEYETNWQPESEGDIMPPGTGGQTRILLTGLTPGEATITFTYKRAWEENAPLYTLVYHVCVDEELNVTIVNSRFEW